MPLWFCDFNCGEISFYKGHQKSRYSLNQIDINTMAMSMMIIIKILIKWVWSKPVAMQSASKACSTEDVVELSIFFVLSLSPQAWALHIFPVFKLFSQFPTLRVPLSSWATLSSFKLALSNLWLFPLCLLTWSFFVHLCCCSYWEAQNVTFPLTVCKVFSVTVSSLLVSLRLTPTLNTNFN